MAVCQAGHAAAANSRPVQLYSYTHLFQQHSQPIMASSLPAIG